MWDWRSKTSEAGYRDAPRYFRINPLNTSGKRLYKLIGPNAALLVTDACRELVSSSKEHGTPDPKWLFENLTTLKNLDRMDVLLVCGKVAQSTYAKCGFDDEGIRVLHILHPAARTWTKDLIQKVTLEISNGRPAQQKEIRTDLG